jgi:cytidylate kinase
MTKPRARRPVIAIDGPAGAGKSTLAARLAQKLGYVNIESGAMYRALALKAIEESISLDDEAALTALARGSRIQLQPAAGEGNRVLLDGRNVSRRIRQQDVTDAASRVSVHPAVREWMVARQRELGASGGVVMEGRDIGTQVFPDAEVKIFLDAAPEIRGQRRFQQQPGAAAPPPEEVLGELRRRDLRDRSRAHSPLTPAPDAVVLDSTALSLDQVVARVEAVLARKLSAARTRRPPRTARPR